MNKKILNLAVPNIISNITVPFLGLVDLTLLGHLNSEIYIGAIAVGTIIFNIIYWGFSFLRMGTSGFTAQAIGKKNFEEISLIFSRAMLIAFLGSLLLIILQKPIALISFSILNASPEVETLASEYFYIRIWAAPATIGLYVLYGWFIGMQNAKSPMIIAILVNLLNIIFDVIFINVFDMKSSGAALGTVLAQYIGFGSGLFIFFKYYFKKLKPYLIIKKIFVLKDIKKFLNVNNDIFIRTMCLLFVLSFFTAESAKNGNLILAVNTLLLQFFTLYSYLIDGFAYAGEALVGKYTGARNTFQLKKVIKLLFIWGASISLIFTLAYIFGGNIILHILTNNEAVIQQSTKYIFWIGMIPFITFAAFLWDGIYIGAIASTYLRNSMIIASFLIFLPLYYLLKTSLGNNSLWFAFIMFMFFRGFLLSIFAKKAIFKPL